MPPRQRGGIGRRKLLLVAGSTISLGVALESDAFTTVTGNRSTDINVASQGDGIVGITPKDSVKKNSQDPLVEFENNYGETATITVTLDSGSDGTLHDPEGDSGNSVTFTLLNGKSEWVDLTAAIQGTVTYDVDITAPNFGIDWSGSVEAESGNNPGVIDIQSPSKDQEFKAYPKKDYFELKAIDVKDNDGDDDLDRIELEITETGGSGTVVATKTIDQIPGDRYAPSGQPDATIYPNDSSYDVTTSQVYNLDFKVYDADGNFASASLDDDP